MRRIAILVPLALSAALLAGCSMQPSGTMVGGDGMSEPSWSMEDSSVGGPAEAWDAVREESGDTGVVGPQIITTVSLTVSVTTPLTAADDAANIANKFGGSVSYRNESAATDYSPGSAQLTLRIPSKNLDQALADLKNLGEARDTSISSVDVTTQVTDLAARITSLQTSVDRLLTLMAQATSTENLLAVESALSQRQAELEGLQAQKRYLDDQVQLSTVDLYLISERDTPAAEPDTFWSGLITGWNAFVAFWAGALVVFGVAVPWLIAVAVIAAIVIVWVRTARRRRRAGAKNATPNDASTTTAERV